MSKKILTMTLEVTYEGDYYSPDELLDVTESWIEGGFCDRDDLTGWTTTSSSVVVSEDDVR